MHLRCKNNILSTYLLHSKNLHKKYDNGKRNKKNMIMERETKKNIQNRQKQHKKYDNGKKIRRKKNIQVQLWMNQKDNRIANLHNLDDLQQKNKRGNSLV